MLLNSGKTSFLNKIKKASGYAPLAFMLCYLVVSVVVHPAFLFPAVVYGWLTFRGTMDRLQGIGPIYWLIRRDPRLVHLGVASMHELASPWRKGRGIYLVAFHRSFQIGVCQKQHITDTMSGLLSAVGGRYLDVDPEEIRNWHGTQKQKEAGQPTP